MYYLFINENQIPKGKINIHVSPDAISKMTGQKRSNIARLRELGYDAKITADKEMNKYQVYILRNEEL